MNTRHQLDPWNDFLRLILGLLLATVAAAMSVGCAANVGARLKTPGVEADITIVTERAASAADTLSR